MLTLIDNHLKSAYLYVYFAHQQLICALKKLTNILAL